MVDAIKYGHAENSGNKEKKLKSHNINDNKNLTLNQELDESEYNEKDAVNLILKRGQISLHDVYLIHGSEANNSSMDRRAITMRFMPTSSVFDHQMVKDKNLFSKLNVSKYQDRKIYHMRGKDISGKNVGTKDYCAPEIFLRHYYSTSDIFSLGCIFWILLTKNISKNKLHHFGTKIWDSTHLQRSEYIAFDEASDFQVNMTNSSVQ